MIRRRKPRATQPGAAENLNAIAAQLAQSIGSPTTDKSLRLNLPGGGASEIFPLRSDGSEKNLLHTCHA
jgi:hypothetical protein